MGFAFPDALDFRGMPAVNAVFTFDTAFAPALCRDPMGPGQQRIQRILNALRKLRFGSRDIARQAAQNRALALDCLVHAPILLGIDRKSTRLNSSHVKISYAVFCLKKKKTIT